MEGLMYWWRLSRLKMARARTDALYRRLVNEAYAEGGEAEHLSAEWRLEDHTHELHIGRLQSGRLLRLADELMLPVPTPSEASAWEEPHEGWLMLSRSKRVELRALIRKERHEASQTALSWIAAITGLGGVIVAIIALLAGE